MNLEHHFLLRHTWILLLVGLLILSCSTDKKTQLTDIVKRSMSSVVLITAFDGRDSVLSRGTGFFLSPNRLLTNMHVIKDACKAEATTASGKILSIAFVLSDSKNSDLVEVEVEGTVEHQTMLPLSDHLPDEGERVVVLGNPLGLQGTVTDGIISSIRAVEPFGSVIQMTAPVHARGILPTQAI